MREDGTRVVSKEGRQALARLSVIDCRTGLVLMDDYVLPSEVRRMVVVDDGCIYVYKPPLVPTHHAVPPHATQ